MLPQVGGREDSNVYIRMKLRAAEEIGEYRGPSVIFKVADVHNPILMCGYLYVVQVLLLLYSYYLCCTGITLVVHVLIVLYRY